MEMPPVTAETATALRCWSQTLELAVEQHLGQETSGHDSFHAFRVRDLGSRIAALIDADTDVVEAAALLHDVGHGTGRDGHPERGAEMAAAILSKCSFPSAKVGAVLSCIQRHHWMPNRAGDPENPTLEYQAFADADRLDALGAIGIARTFAFGGANGRPVWNPKPEAIPLGQYGVSSVHHFYDKLLHLPNDMYTEPARRIAVRRVALMQDFLRELYVEWEAGDFCAAEEAAGFYRFTGPSLEASGKGQPSHPSDVRLDPSTQSSQLAFDHLR